MIIYLLFFITIWAVAVVTFVLGYLFGHHNMEHLAAQAVNGIRKIRNKLERNPSGIVYRPTAKDLKKMNRTEKEIGTEEALNETFEKIPELSKAKQYAKGVVHAYSK